MGEKGWGRDSLSPKRVGGGEKLLLPLPLREREELHPSSLLLWDRGGDFSSSPIHLAVWRRGDRGGIEGELGGQRGNFSSPILKDRGGDISHITLLSGD